MNVQPEHKAILEGSEEVVITEHPALPFPVEIGDGFASRELPVVLRPQSFFQTNTDAAAQLYRQSVVWLAGAHSVWDLYCGVGGFAFALALYGDAGEVIGVETANQAVHAANSAASALDLGGRSLEFVCADAAEWVRGQAAPDAIVVNPPRRGIGRDLSQWLNNSGVERIVYSSCNVESLARDLEIMNNYEVTQGQVVDMFAHTSHFECVCLMSKV